MRQDAARAKVTVMVEAILVSSAPQETKDVVKATFADYVATFNTAAEPLSVSAEPPSVSLPCGHASASVAAAAAAAAGPKRLLRGRSFLPTYN